MLGDGLRRAGALARAGHRPLRDGRNRLGRAPVAREVFRRPRRAVARHQLGGGNRRGADGADQLERAGRHVIAVGDRSAGRVFHRYRPAAHQRRQLARQLLAPHPDHLPPGRGPRAPELGVDRVDQRGGPSAPRDVDVRAAAAHHLVAHDRRHDRIDAAEVEQEPAVHRLAQAGQL